MDPITSDEHLESIQVDLINQEFSRTSPNPTLAITSLREFNSQLLERISQFRKRNLELSASEAALRSALSDLQASRANYDRVLAQKDQELARLQALHRTAVEALEKSNRGHLDELKSLENSKTEMGERIEKLSSELTETKTALEQTLARETQVNEAYEKLRAELTESKENLEQLRQRETQAIEAFDKVRAEYSQIDKCFQEATERAAHLSAQLSESKTEFEKILVNMNAQLQADFQRQFQALLGENRKLQERLEMRDNRIETELAKLKTRQDQVGFLEQHLNQVTQAIRKDKADLLRLAKLLSQEPGRPNPFKDATDAARVELANLLKKLSSQNSPV